MNEQKYNTQAIVEYLLGSLPEADSERFDELSFTDEEFANALAFAENDLVDRYARGELTGATLERFKRHYLASPARREKVMFAGAFQTYAEHNIQKTSENIVAEKAQPEKNTGSFFSSFNVFKNKNFILQWGFVAAALLLLILSGVWILNNRQAVETAKQNQPENRDAETPKRIEERKPENSNAEPEIAATNSENNLPQSDAEKEPPKKSVAAPQTKTLTAPKNLTLPKIIVASFVLTPSLRGGSDNQITNFSIPKEATEVNVALELEADDYSAYRVALADETGSSKIWQSGAIRATGKGESKRLNISFPAKLLKSRIYTLIVSGVSDEGKVEIVSNYSFRSVIK